MIQIGVFSKKSYLELKSYLITISRYSHLKCESKRWDNDEFILYYDYVAKCP